jgi:hypothetical protein
MHERGNISEFMLYQQMAKPLGFSIDAYNTLSSNGYYTVTDVTQVIGYAISVKHPRCDV